MSRRVGFGEAEEGPSGASRPAPKAVGWRIILAIVVAFGVGAWILAGLGGTDDALDAFVRVAHGDAPLADLLSVILPGLFVLIAALVLLFRGVWSSQPRIPELAPDKPRAQGPAGRGKTRPARQPTRRQRIEQKIDDKLPTGAGRVFAGVFLSVWLIGWSTGIVFAFGALLSEWGTGPSLFLIVWLTFAILGWFFAVGFLFKIIRGR